MNRTQATLLTLTVITISTLLGCATGRRTLNVTAPESVNPASGPSTRIARVTDGRVFVGSYSARDHSIRPKAANEPGIKSRLIGRKQSGEGMIMGDVALREGLTVADLIESALVVGLRQSGYQVLVDGEPGYEEATPLEVDIDRFWSWKTNKGTRCEIHISVEGGIEPLVEGLDFHVTGSEGPQLLGFLSLDTYHRSVKKALKALTESIHVRLQGSGEIGPAGGRGGAG